MTAFVTFRDTDSERKLQYYILQRGFPHYVGRISEKPIEQPLAISPIGGYYLWVVVDGTLRGGFIPGYKNVIEEMQNVADTMADWFYENRILIDPKRYKKFKINSNAASPYK